MRLSDFDYQLPEELIAQQPLRERGASRLLCLDGASGDITDRVFADLPGLLRRGDLLVFNDTRVIPARLFGHKPTGGRIEVLCMPRILGYVFNPITVYYVYGKDGGLAAVLYEVNNTFGERHCYLAKVDARSRSFWPSTRRPTRGRRCRCRWRPTRCSAAGTADPPRCGPLDRLRPVALDWRADSEPPSGGRCLQPYEGA